LAPSPVGLNNGDPGGARPRRSGGTASSSAINTAFSQSGTYSITTNALVSAYVLQFDFSSTAVSAQDGASIRMGLAGSLR